MPTVVDLRTTASAAAQAASPTVRDPVDGSGTPGLAGQPASSRPAEPVVFLAIDGVLCLNRRFTGFDVADAFESGDLDRPELWAGLFDAQARDALLALHATMEQAGRPAGYVLGSAWADAFGRERCVEILERTGLSPIARRLMRRWRTPHATELPPVVPGEPVGAATHRLREIEAWLNRDAAGGPRPFVVLADRSSADALLGSAIDRAGRLVQCAPDAGLQRADVVRALRALTDVPATHARSD